MTRHPPCAFRSRSRFWIAVSRSSAHGEMPVELLHTTDAGRSWVDDGSFPRAYSYAWIDFLTPSRGWLMVDNGAAMDQDPVTIYQTDSGGARWTELAQSPIQTITNGTLGAPSPGRDKSGINFSSATSGWIAGDCTANALLQHTGDGGRHWQVVPLACPDQRADCGGSTSLPQFFGAIDGALSAELYSAHGLAIVIHDCERGQELGGAPVPGHHPGTEPPAPMAPWSSPIVASELLGPGGPICEHSAKSWHLDSAVSIAAAAWHRQIRPICGGCFCRSTGRMT